jgi:hypothetical protein
LSQIYKDKKTLRILKGKQEFENRSIPIESFEGALWRAN